jgi:hypothetical protein
MNALFAGTYLTKDAEVCGGNMTITSLCYQLGSLDTAPVPESAVASFAVQRTFKLLGETYTAEKSLGFDMGTITTADNLADEFTFPLPNAVQVAQSGANYPTLRWDQARVDQTMNEFEGLVVALDEAAPGWSAHRDGAQYGISSYFRFLLAIHIKKLIMLSDLATVDVAFTNGETIAEYVLSDEYIGWDVVYMPVLVDAAYKRLSDPV